MKIKVYIFANRIFRNSFCLEFVKAQSKMWLYKAEQIKVLVNDLDGKVKRTTQHIEVGVYFLELLRENGEKKIIKLCKSE